MVGNKTAEAKGVNMGRSIIKLQEHYLVWSSIVDAPITFGLTLDELRAFIKEEYGRSGLDYLDHSLKRVEQFGISNSDYQYDGGLDDFLAPNRAGPGEDELTKDEIYQAYVLRQPIRDGWLAE
jgi:hypothetical protein